jgi:hypothetical protein
MRKTIFALANSLDNFIARTDGRVGGMNFMNRLVLLLGALSLSACWAFTANAQESLFADMVLLNGKIITVEAKDHVAQAVAIRDGKIVAVGSNRKIERLCGSQTQRIDLKGLTATPGLLDAHAHFVSGGTNRLFKLELSFPNVKSIANVVEKVAAQVKQLKPGEWVQGSGWDEGKLQELRYIHAADLDSVAAENPVYLSHTMGHYGVANSLALKLANITRDTPDPPSGTIDRFSDGTPTGVLKEAAQDLVMRLIPELTSKQMQAGIKALVKEFNQEGMTGVKDPGITRQEWEAYQHVLAEGALTVRVFALWEGSRTPEGAQELIERVGPFTKPYVTTGDDHLISGGIKMWLDGSGGARTAWLFEEWNKNHKEIDKGNYGYPVIAPDTLRELVKKYHDAGLHVSVHAIGDRAIDWVVDSYDLALKANPASGRRHGIIHANIPTDHALGLMAELQRAYDAAYPEPSATFMWWIGDTYAGNFGPKRALRLNPFKTYLEKGIRWAGGSDYYVTPFAARYGLWASLARETLLGVYGPNPYGQDEAIDIRSALRSYTIWSARQMFLEDKIGSIAAGKYADIAVWDRDLYHVPPGQIKELQCQMTIFNGRIVYQRPDAPLKILKGK